MILLCVVFSPAFLCCVVPMSDDFSMSCFSLLRFCSGRLIFLVVFSLVFPGGDLFLLRFTHVGCYKVPYVLLSTAPCYKELLRTTKYYSGTLPHYKALLRTAKQALLRTTPHHQVLLHAIKCKHVLQRTTPYYRDPNRAVTMSFIFDSRSTLSIQYIARSNLWDAKCNVISATNFK